MSKREPEQEHMPVVQVSTGPGSRGECDYCEKDATWWHWADERSTNRDARACDDHAHLLNRFVLVN
jgi:hypothetical protein